MKRIGLILITVLGVLTFALDLAAAFLHTVDRKVYEGEMVAFKFNVIYFNVYKYGKIYRTERFPINDVWKIEFNEPQKSGLASPAEIEQNYDRLRKGKRIKKIVIPANQKWIDTGIMVKIGQEILFSITGSINIDKDTVVNQSGKEYVDWGKNKPMPNQPCGAVIGRVGKKGEMFYIGDDKAPFQMAEAGELAIGINDTDFSDNSGQFTLTIYY